MAFKKKYKSVTRRTKKLLLNGENDFVDFKKVADGIHAEDLVSFANTSTGGDIFVGVVERKGADGSQYGEIGGTDLEDDTVLKIVNKAISCDPPISIGLYAENTDKCPLIRVNVLPSNNRPHCTPKGVYCVRDGNRNRPLRPGELLAIFLDSEAKAFASRFEDAAVRISAEISELEDSLETTIRTMSDTLGWAEFNLGSTESTVERTLAYARNIVSETEDTNARLRVLFRQDDREDPVRKKFFDKFRDELVAELRDKQELLEQIRAGEVNLELSANARYALELNQDDMRRALADAVKIIDKDEKTGSKTED